MKIRQYRRKLISNKKILDIIKLLKHDNKNFKKHTVKKIIIWNSQILYYVYNLFLLETSTTTNMFTMSYPSYNNDFINEQFNNLDEWLTFAQGLVNNPQIAISRLKRKKEG